MRFDCWSSRWCVTCWWVGPIAPWAFVRSRGCVCKFGSHHSHGGPGYSRNGLILWWPRDWACVSLAVVGSQSSERCRTLFGCRTFLAAKDPYNTVCYYMRRRPAYEDWMTGWLGELLCMESFTSQRGSRCPHQSVSQSVSVYCVSSLEGCWRGKNRAFAVRSRSRQLQGQSRDLTWSVHILCSILRSKTSVDSPEFSQALFSFTRC
jgi:hypothetical protein